MSVGSEIEVHRNSGLASFEGAAPAIKNAMGTLAAVSEFVQTQLVDGVDYGMFEGIKKKCLLQPGAGKIAMLFNCHDSYDIRTTEMGNGHVEHVVITKLILRNGSDIVLAEGVGSCSSMEGRYRYRNSEPESTGRTAPKTYWDKKNAEDWEGAQAVIGGKGFTVRKIDGQWMICKATDGKVENPNIHDVRNTVLKMAKKRSKVDAALNLGCVADLFTQDVDEMDLPRKQASSPPADNRSTSEKVKTRREQDDRQRQEKRSEVKEQFKPAERAEKPWSVEEFKQWIDAIASKSNEWWKKQFPDADEFATFNKNQQEPFNRFRLVGHLCKFLEREVPAREGLNKQPIDEKIEVLTFEMAAWRDSFSLELKQYCKEDVPAEIRAEIAKKAEKAAAKAQVAEPVEVVTEVVTDDDGEVWKAGRE